MSELVSGAKTLDSLSNPQDELKSIEELFEMPGGPDRITDTTATDSAIDNESNPPADENQNETSEKQEEPPAPDSNNAQTEQTDIKAVSYTHLWGIPSM